MKNTTIASLIAAPLMIFALSVPSWADDAAPTTCKDGTTTASTGKGTCSGHGGVQKPAKTKVAPAATPAPAAAPAPTAAAPAAAGAATTCKDGSTTTSTGKGTCSGHGGVQKPTKVKAATASTAATPATAPAAAPATAPAPAAAAKTATATKSAPSTTASNTDPTGATAKCKDGTYSKSQHHSGTCSSHGGVAEWLTAK
jgi:Protein of unknown function (DUF3761)